MSPFSYHLAGYEHGKAESHWRVCFLTVSRMAQSAPLRLARLPAALPDGLLSMKLSELVKCSQMHNRGSVP